MTLGLLVVVLVQLGLYVSAQTPGETVDCLIDFNIYVSQNGQFCNGTETIAGSLSHPVYFQYKTDTNWTPLRSYNESTLVKELKFVISTGAASIVQFRWVQHNTLASPAWAVDSIRINCTQLFLNISFDEDSSDLERRLECHSGSVQATTEDCSDTEFSLVFNGTERELQTTNFNLSSQMGFGNNTFRSSCAVTCSPLTAPGNGTMNCSSTTDGVHYVRDTCSYTCGSGFVLNDTDERECQSDGSWNGTEPFCRKECTTNGYDVILILDVSVSAHNNVGVERIRSFITRVVEFLDIGATRSLVGLIYFAGDANVVFNLQEYTTKHALISALRSIPYPVWRGTKFIPVLHLLNETAHNDSMGFRPNYPNIAIILTEGKLRDTERQLKREAKQFHMQQLYQLFAVGVGDVDPGQLETVTDDPSVVYLVDNLEEPAREHIMQNLSQQLCKSRMLCPPLTAPSNGTINCTGNMFEDTCTFSCDQGYELSGSETWTCQSNITWNGTDVICTLVSCPPLTVPNNGMINCTGNMFEDTCTFSCDQGYELSGSETRTCQSDQTWNDTEAMCTAVSCQQLTTVLNNGTINCTGNMFEDTCTFSCDQGYELSGSETRTCQSDQTWNSTNVRCTPVSCPPFTAPNNGMINCTGNVFEDTCTFSCDQGYELSGSGTQICQSDQTWSGTDVRCIVVSCPPLTAPYNGSINCTGNMFEDTCTFSCDQGYELSGSETRTCQSDQTWNGTEAMCTIVSCLPLTALNNGTINCTGNMFEDTCTFSCDQGYELSGSETRTCQSDQTWSSTNVRCTPVSCPPFTAPNNGMIDCTGNVFGDTCTFSCDQGYELSDSGTQICQSDQTWSGTDVRCILVCLGPNLSYGLVWPTTAPNQTVEQDCSDIHRLFWRGPKATRKCLHNGRWDNVDIRQCTVRERSSLLLFSTYLEKDDACDIEKTDGLQLLQLVDTNTNETITDCSDRKNEQRRLAHQASSVHLAVFASNLNFSDQSALCDTIESLAKNYSKFREEFGPPELLKLSSVDGCKCADSSVTSQSGSLLVIDDLMCIGSPVSPCARNSSTTSSGCNRPQYVGNGSICGYDEDLDGLPNKDIGCSEDYCRGDGCPANPGADVCMPNRTDCVMGKDPEYGIEWHNATSNTVIQTVCPEGTGFASRRCNLSGEWEIADVKNCSRFVFQELKKEVSSVLDNPSDQALPRIVDKIQRDLVELIQPGEYSIFPLDLKIANCINTVILDIVKDNTDILEIEGFTNTSVGLQSDLLDSINKPAFLQLLEVNPTENQQLIVNTERLGVLLASNIINTSSAGNNSMVFEKENIDISVEKRNKSNTETIIFPNPQSDNDVDNGAAIRIPASLVKERSEAFADGMVPIAHISYRNLEEYLPGNLSMAVPVSSVISSQVGNASMPVSSNEPVMLTFQHNAGNITGSILNTTRCVFWNFTLNGVTGGWDTNNVVVVDYNETFITCSSTHLTSFAVLVDVSGGTSKLNKGERTALKIVSYIGCSVSIVCSLIAICLLLLYRNTLLKGTHNFTHLNLAIALLLGLCVFVVGIEGGTYNKIVCTVVAALLHYLFTAVFSWMLCEGILLYVLLVKVFNLGLLTKRKLYFVLGWGIPIPIVGISVGIAYEHYGTDKFCWISTDEEAIWAFAGPMLLIITVNVGVLIMVVYVLYKTKSQQMKAGTASKIAIVKSILKATVVLLPLLGLTWAFGLLAVNKNTSVFAWIFTVLNSLQGLFLLGLHVIRNEKVRGRIKRMFGFREPGSTVITGRSPYFSKKVMREATSKKQGNLSDGSQSMDKVNCNNYSSKEFSPQSESQRFSPQSESQRFSPQSKSPQYNPQLDCEHYDAGIKVEIGQCHNGEQEKNERLHQKLSVQTAVARDIGEIMAIMTSNAGAST